MDEVECDRGNAWIISITRGWQDDCDHNFLLHLYSTMMHCFHRNRKDGETSMIITSYCIYIVLWCIVSQKQEVWRGQYDHNFLLHLLNKLMHCCHNNRKYGNASVIPRSHFIYWANLCIVFTQNSENDEASMTSILYSIYLVNLCVVLT